MKRLTLAAIVLSLFLVSLNTFAAKPAEKVHWGIAGIEVVTDYSLKGKGALVVTQGIIVGKVIDLGDNNSVDWAEVDFSSMINTIALRGVSTGDFNVFDHSDNLAFTGKLIGRFTLSEESDFTVTPPDVVTKKEMQGRFTSTRIIGREMLVRGKMAVTHFLRVLGLSFPGYYTGVDADVEVQLFRLLFHQGGNPTGLYYELLEKAASLLDLSLVEILALDPKPIGIELTATEITFPRRWGRWGNIKED